jgi:hypothetical protein
MLVEIALLNPRELVCFRERRHPQIDLDRRGEMAAMGVGISKRFRKNGGD